MATLENLELYENRNKNLNLILNEKSTYNFNSLFEHS